MLSEKDKKKAIDILKDEELIEGNDQQSLYDKLLETEIKEGKEKDIEIQNIIKEMKRKGLIFAPCLLIILCSIL